MNFTFDPKTHTYALDGKPMTGMTTLLGILGKPALIPWAARMAVEYIKENSEWVDQRVAMLPDLSHHKVTPKTLEEAKTAYAKKRDDAASKGTDTHALVEEYVKACIEKNQGLPVLYPNQDNLIAPFMNWAAQNVTRFLASEQQVYSKELFVAGTFDLMFEKDGKRYMGDVKTYKKIWDTIPFIQCAGYAYCWEEMQSYEERTNLQGDLIDGYCIINLPKERTFEPEKDVLWNYDTEGQTQQFLACVTLYKGIKKL